MQSLNFVPIGKPLMNGVKIAVSNTKFDLVDL